MLDKPQKLKLIRVSIASLICCAATMVAHADESPSTREELQLLHQQNELLKQQLGAQQKLIDSLTHKVESIEQSTAKPSAISGQDSALAPDQGSGLKFGKVDITGEAAVGFFQSQSKGKDSKGTFRIDEARLFLDAPVWDDVYFSSELDLASRESTSLALNVGALYLDFEDVSKIWGKDKMLNVRVGRFYIPFGEEYLTRFSMENPLISHSVSDFWGTDDGLELYGKVSGISYAAAVQNGGVSTSQAFQSDKTVSAKLGADPAKWLHVSVSGMRTGNLSVKNGMSAMWFGNGFFRSLGSASTTTFHDNIVEADVQLNLPGIALSGLGGYINYDDNDSIAHNNRDVYYYAVQGVHEFSHRFYAAARYSEVMAHKGFPIVGNGNFGTYEYSKLTCDYWRLSLALGYRLSPHLMLKGEYYFNGGHAKGGVGRSAENGLIMEAACNF